MSSTKNAAGVISRLSYSEDSAVIALYQKQLEGLTLTQQKLAMSTAGLTAEQQKFILSKIQEEAVVGKATTASLLELSKKNQETLKGAGVVLSNEAESNSEVVLTKAIYDKIIAATADNEVTRQQILNSFGVTNANIKQASSYDLLGGSLKSIKSYILDVWNATEGMGGSLKRVGGTMKGLWDKLPQMGKIGIIAAIIVAVNKLAGMFYDTTEEIQQKIEDAKNKISETESEISSLDSQINETTELINKMKEAGASEDAISTYEKENQLLRDQKKILEDIIKDEKTVIANESARLINNEGSSSRLDGMLGALQNFDIMGSSKQTPIIGGFLGMGDKSNGFERDGYIEDFEKGGFWNGMKNIALDLFAPTVSTFMPFEDPADDIVLQSDRLIEKFSAAESGDVSYTDSVGLATKMNLSEKWKMAFGSEEEKQAITQKYKNEILKENKAGALGVLNEYIPQLIESRNAMAKDNAEGVYTDEIKKIDDVLAKYYKARPDIGFEVVFKGEDDVVSGIGDEIFSKYKEGGKSEDLEKIISSRIQKDGALFKKLEEYGLIDGKDANWAGSLADKFVEYFSSGNAEIEKTWKNIDKTTASINDLEKASDNINTLGSAFKELSDNGYITTKTLGEIQTATGLSGDEWEDYKTRLLSAKKGSSDFNQVMSDLTYKILDATFKKEGLVDATKDEIAAVLRENGISNASAVAHDYLARTISSEEKAKAENSIKTRLLSGDIAGLIKNLSSEATACGLTETAFKNLAIQMVLTNETNMSFDSQIANLKALGVAAEITAAKIAGVNGYRNTKYSEKRNARGNMDSRGGLITSVGQETINGSTYIVYYGENGQIVDKEKIGADYDNLTTPKIPTYTSGGKSGSGTNDAAKKELDALKASLEARKEVIERYKEFVELTDFGLDLAEEDDFGLKSELLTGKISQLTSYGRAMREEFDRIANTIPETGDQADALADRLQELGSDMRSNITEIRKTQTELRKLSIDMASTLVEDRMGELQSQLDSFDRQIDILNSDYKDDYRHVSDMLSMDMLLPSYSDFGGMRSNLSNKNRDLIRGEQETQNTINDIIETQIKKNEELRETERQAILADMEAMRGEVQLHLNNVNAKYDSSWRDSQITTDNGIKGIENALNNMDMKIPEPDISNVVRACELVKEMLENMGNAEYTPPKIKVSDGIDGGDAQSIISGNKSNIVSNIAKNQLGVPYVWGGVAPGVGLDCSGLTQYAYRVAGVSLPRRSQEQWSCGIGTRIDWGNLKKGDQLFFGDGNEATHTGIYVGNGQMIHAPRTGDVVKYTSINTEYYQGRFLGAKRYAVGTPKGNVLAKNLGIAGENYKPEVLIDKATGKATYIDKPTIIDPSKTDVIGEKATERMPKFANGTEDDSVLDKLVETIEGFYTKATNEIGNISSKYAKEYIGIMNNNSLGDFEKAEALYDVQYRMGQKNSSAGKIIYEDLQNRFYQWLDDVEAGTEDWSLEIYEAYTNTLDKIKDSTYDMADNAVEAKRTAAEMRWDNSSNWISDRNFYNDWELFGDSEVEAWGRVVKWLREDYPNELDKIKEAEQNLFEARKKLVDDLLNELQDELDNDFDIRIKRLNSQSTLLSSHFNIVNAISEEQHNLNKELLEAETIGAKMNEQERETLFTKKEHVRLSDKLSDIMVDVAGLQHDYMRDLETATLDTIDEITNQYERQYDLKMKEYEIVKAELSLAKAQQVLENTENEKSVRTWTGSGWSYEANLQEVINAQESVEDAKYALLKSKTEEAQQTALNAIDANADALETEKNKFASALEEMAEKMDGSGKDITSMLQTIAKTDLPTFDAIVQEMGQSIAQALGISKEEISNIRSIYGGDQKYEDSALDVMKANSNAWLTADEEVRGVLEAINKDVGKFLGLDFEPLTGRWKKKNGAYAYALGTSNAHKGLGLFDEDGFGSELILTKDGVLTQFDGGERVFNSEMADRLWEMAQQNYRFTPDIHSNLAGLASVEDRINNIINNINNAVGDTYMVNGVQLNESEGGTLKGFIDFLKKKI